MTIPDINGTHGSIALSTSQYGNPVTVDKGAVVDANQASYALNAQSTWTIQNFGSITAPAGDGIDLEAGGLVINGNGANAGTITGGNLGIYMAEAPGNSVVNYSQIHGGVAAVFLKGGAVSNAAAGTITGGADGVYMSGSLGIVVNSGAINGAGKAAGDAGVALAAGGSVNNAGAISGGYDGVSVTGRVGAVVNSGTISSATHDGIFLQAGGYVDNAAGGTVAGNDDGVRVASAQGVVVNTGSIYGYAFNGVLLQAGGSVNNQSGGSITAYKGEGVYLAAGGYVSNANGGTIAGGDSGVVAAGARGTVINAGSIGGSVSAGVSLSDGGTVYNAGGGTIAGGVKGDGVNVGNATGTVVNAGAIYGTAYDGVYMNAGGSVTNAGGGTLNGNNDGINIAGSRGIVDNSGFVYGFYYNGILLQAGGSVTNRSGGTIIGYKFEGVYLAAGGYVTNAVSASVAGGDSGILAAGDAATVANAGTIVGAASAGVSFEAGGTIANAGDGIITGYTAGIEVQGQAGFVINAGYIAGAASASPGNGGVILAAGGYISNAPGGTITDASNGVVISGGPGRVVNAGAISGIYYAGVALYAGGSVANRSGGTIAGNVGVDLASGGTVVNDPGATITGFDYGIFVKGGAGTVENAGTINFYAHANGTDAVSFAGSGANRLIIDAGAMFGGAVVASGTDNTIELAASGGPGTFDGLGTAYQGFQTLVVDAGANWTIGGSLAGANAVYGVENGGTLSNGSFESVYAGGVASGNVIESGAVAEILSGGIASGTELSDGGSLTLIYGAAADITIDGGGSEFQFAGSSNDLALDGGHLSVLGGSATGIAVYGGGFEFAGTFNDGPAGGTLINTEVNSGGVLAMGVRGAAVSARIEAGAVLFELAGVTSDVTLLGTQYVGGQLPGVPIPDPAPSAIASATLISSGGFQRISSDGNAIDTTILGGGLAEVFAGGTVTNAVVSAGGSLAVVFGTASGVTVDGGGTEYQFAGLTDAVTVSGGRLIVDGGTASGIMVDSGGLEFAGTFNNGPAGGTLIDSEVSSGGILAMGVNGALSGAQISSGAFLLELAGITNDVVLAGGTQFVGGQLPGVPLPNPPPAAVALGTTVSSGGLQQVNSNGSAVGTSVLTGGEIVFNGGAVSDLSLSSGGVIDLAAFAFSSATSIGFVENAGDTGGALTVGSGIDSLTINLLGQYVAGGFQESPDGGTGTAISYSPPVTSQVELAGHHGAG